MTVHAVPMGDALMHHPCFAEVVVTAALNLGCDDRRTHSPEAQANVGHRCKVRTVA